MRRGSIEREMVDIFRNGNFEVFALTMKKMKGNGKISWWEENGIRRNTRERKGCRR